MRFCRSIWLCLLLLSACSRAPEGVLSQSKMEDVLVDMYRADGIIYALSRSDNPLPADSVYRSVLRQHGVTQAEFDSSMAYYNGRGTQFERMYIQIDRRVTTAFEEALQAAAWADADRQFHWVGWTPPEPPAAGELFRFKTANDYEAISQSSPLLPDPRTF